MSHRYSDALLIEIPILALPQLGRNVNYNMVDFQRYTDHERIKKAMNVGSKQ
jgi:hypothetical protein